MTNHHQMQELFDREKSTYEMSATEANQYGLEVSDSYPFESLDHFYGSCDDIFHAFYYEVLLKSYRLSLGVWQFPGPRLLTFHHD